MKQFLTFGLLLLLSCSALFAISEQEAYVIIAGCEAGDCYANLA